MKEKNNMKTLCLYYTRTNTTKTAMEHLAKLLGADLAEYTDGKEQLLGKNIYIFDDFGNSLVEETYDSMNVLDTRYCYEYKGTDGSISSGIPNEK